MQNVEEKQVDFSAFDAKVRCLTSDDLTHGGKQKLMEHIKEIRLLCCLPLNPLEVKSRMRLCSCESEGRSAQSVYHAWQEDYLSIDGVVATLR